MRCVTCHVLGSITLTLASKELSTKMGWVCATTDTAKDPHSKAKPKRKTERILTTHGLHDRPFDSMPQV
jgi:hypothetical protein